VAKPIILVLALALIATTLYFLPVVEYLTVALTWIEENPTISWAVFILAYVLACVLLLPGSILTLGAGFIFGLSTGYLVVAVGSVLGASCAFLIGRFFARDWVEARLGAMPRFNALDRAIEQRGALIVFLTRLSPLFPFNLLNYALGLTGVRFPVYVIVSWLGMIPGSLLYVYLGSVASDLGSILGGEVTSSPIGNTLFYVGLAATLVLTIVITRIASKTLNEQLQPSAATGEA